MNEYLTKLHSLESGGEHLILERPIVRQPTKPTKLGCVSFVSDRSMGVFARKTDFACGEPQRDMQREHIEGLKSASIGHRQNRRNPEQSSTVASFGKALSEFESACPAYIESDRWQQCLGDAHSFLATWGERAVALGWTVDDLFGLHTPPTNPHPSYSRLSRYDCTGLLWGLEGRRVVAITDTTAAVQGFSGSNITIYRKTNKPAYGPLGDSLDDFIA